MLLHLLTSLMYILAYLYIQCFCVCCGGLSCQNAVLLSHHTLIHIHTCCIVTEHIMRTHTLVTPLLS